MPSGTNYGVTFNATIETSGTGTISLTGTGGIAAGNSNYGINVGGSGTIQTSGTGANHLHRHRPADGGKRE